MTQKLNTIDKESLDLWNQKIKPILIKVIDILKLSYPKEIGFYFDALTEKANSVGDPTNLKICLQGILRHSVNQFNINLAKILAKK